MRRVVLLVGIVFAVPLLFAPAARASDSCEERCHVDRTGGGGGCTGTTDEDREAEARCRSNCGVGQRTPTTTTTTSTSAPTKPIPPTGECAETVTKDACMTCCSDNHAAAAKAFEADVLACLCAPDVCASECRESACASPSLPTDATCAACLNDPNNARVCGAGATQRCRDAVECAPMLSCVTNGCRGKT